MARGEQQQPGPPPWVTVVTFVVVTVMVGAALWLLAASGPPPVEIVINPPAPTRTPSPTGTPGPLTVYVTGAVNRPETLHTLNPGSRVQDALDAAGGALPDADLTGVNLAALLRDGDQIHVPVRGAEAAALPTDGPRVVNVNTATVEELDTLPDIGPAIAQRIVDYRTANGPFTAPEDLLNVPGIGEATLEGLRPWLAFSP